MKTPLRLDHTGLRKLVMQRLSEDMGKQANYLEMMAAAYLQHTNVPPDEVELVEVREVGFTHYFYRRRQG